MNAIGPTLLIATLAMPIVMLAACTLQKLRRYVFAAQWLAALPAIGAALLVLGGAPLSFAEPAFRISLFLDKPAAMLLAVAAVLWIGAGVTAVRGRPIAERFAVCWLLTMIGSFGVFIAADLLTFYLVYALVSIPAFGLIVCSDDAASKRAGGVYMAFTVLGEALLLMGFALLAAGEPTGSLQIQKVMAALPGSPWRDAAMALVIVGFGLKMALVPGHGWMPLAYTAAPIPAAAVLSGAAVKAGVIGLIRFLPFDAALPDWGSVLVIFGFISAFYGVAIGITQRDPKTVLAYSSISQMGVIAAVMGMGLSSADKGAQLDAAFYAAHHALVKGTLFLSIGIVAGTSPRHRRLVLLLSAVMALSLAGLPLTGGALAKLAVKEPLGTGVAGMLAALSAVGTTLLMLLFLMRLARATLQDGESTVATGLDRPWLMLALASVLVPWLMYPAVGGNVADSLTVAAILEALWPVLLGAALASGICLSGTRLPFIPTGDIIVGQEAAFRASFTLGALFERLDSRLRQWPMASLSLLVVALVLAAAGASN
jgi:formate hydrogenlyase subunit 3/multisubunit Na+/H+ antiporter MnhD subunit